MKCLMADFKPFPTLETKPGWTVVPVASNLNGTRTIVFDRLNGDLITIARGLQQIIVLWETSRFSGEFQRAVLIDGSSISPSLNLSHGLAIRNGYIYASSDINIWRWPYKSGARTLIDVNSKELVVFNMVLMLLLHIFDSKM